MMDCPNCERLRAKIKELEGEMITVYCVKCGKAVKLRPDGMGMVSPNFVMWIGELGEKCNDCRLTRAIGHDTVASGAMKGEEFPLRGEA